MRELVVPPSNPFLVRLTATQNAAGRQENSSLTLPIIPAISSLLKLAETIQYKTVARVEYYVVLLLAFESRREDIVNKVFKEFGR